MKIIRIDKYQNMDLQQVYDAIKAQISNGEYEPFDRKIAEMRERIQKVMDSDLPEHLRDHEVKQVGYIYALDVNRKIEVKGTSKRIEK
jgi:hypothetical protein